LIGTFFYRFVICIYRNVICVLWNKYRKLFLSMADRTIPAFLFPAPQFLYWASYMHKQYWAIMEQFDAFIKIFKRFLRNAFIWNTVKQKRVNYRILPHI